MSSTEKSLKLKDEGNAFFAKKKYAQAYKKYTAAILEDGNNAIFFANRAACSLSMMKYGSEYSSNYASLLPIFLCTKVP